MSKKHMIVFGCPEFDDWTNIINNLQIKNIKIRISQSLKYRNRYCLIIPSTINQAISLTKYGEKINIASPHRKHTIALLNNKKLFQNFMECHKALRAYIPTRITGKSIYYPCLLKPCESFGGNGIKIIKNNDDYLQYVSKISTEYILQEVVMHVDYYVGHFYVVNGKIIHQIYYHGKNPDKDVITIKYGRIVQYESEHNNQYSCIFAKIFKIIKYNGFACIDFCIEANTNNLKIFEVNPRLGGSLINNIPDFSDMLLIAHRYCHKH